MTNLSVNVNKIALLRNTRTIGIPSVTKAAQICIDAGAQGITVHPRPDERHITPTDVYELAELVKVEFNIEGNPFEGKFMEIVRKVLPTQCTLVPDSPEAFTSDHGWNLIKDGKTLIPVVEELKELGIRVSIFMDPDIEQVKKAKETGTDRIELYTEPYAASFREGNTNEILSSFSLAAKTAADFGIGVNAGHDLNLQNIKKFCEIGGILEVSIGHALIAEALEMGLYDTVKEYLSILN